MNKYWYIARKARGKFLSWGKKVYVGGAKNFWDGGGPAFMGGGQPLDGGAPPSPPILDSPALCVRRLLPFHHFTTS